MGAILVLPVTVAGEQGPSAALLSTAGWFNACERVVGDSWLVTPDGLFDASELRKTASAPDLSPPQTRSLARRLPPGLKTLAKDVRQIVRRSSFRVDVAGPWASEKVDFVWQRHVLFQSGGVDLAERLRVPSVLFAPATVIWEARRWGVKRRLTGSMLERLGEAPSLRRADVVACGSEEVAEQAIRIGADPAKVLLTPTGTDFSWADHAADGGEVRRSLGLGDGFVLGWVGSFRPFHAVHRLVEAVAGLDGVTLLLVGDGPERAMVETRVRELGVRAVFTGTVEHGELAGFLAAMDAAAVVAPDDGLFHYSPLKLAEYLTSRLAVVAPDVTTISSRLVHDEHLLLVPPTDRAALARAIRRLRDDPVMRSKLGEAGRAEVRERWSWDEQVRAVTQRLNETVRR